MTVNPGPPRGKRRSAGRGNFEPKSVTPAQRVREVPDEQLCVSAGKLFCQAIALLCPHWSALARQVLLVQPSSAAAERVFSLLANSFGDQQNNALQDYVETSIMLQYNKH